MNKTIFYFALSFCILIFAFFTFTVTTANAATLYFSPSSGNFTVGNIFTVNVLVNTENADINNAEATVNFPSGLLEIISISKSGSAFSLWVEEPRFSNSAGTLSFNGGLPTPGFKGTAGKVLGVVFRVKKAGPASLVFSSAAVRANDGYGTNVLKTMNGASFNIGAGSTPQPPVASPKIEAPVVVSSFEISSSTHPDQNKWYSNNDPVFKWNLPKGVTGVSLVLSRRANSPPIINYSPPITEKVLDDIEDGVWYLNGGFRTSGGLGPITSFKFNVDTQPPRNFTLVRLDPDDTTNPRPLLLFESADNTSGIEKYQMKIGTGDWFDIEPNLAGRPFAIPPQRFGDYLVQVKALDFAGNSASSNTEITIKPLPIPPPIIKEVVLPDIEATKIKIVKDEVEIPVKEVVVKEVVVKEVVVKEVVVKEVVVKGLVLQKEVQIKEGLTTRIRAVITDVFKVENGNNFNLGQMSAQDAGLKLIKTVEIPVDKNGKFEGTIENLNAGTYILRAYSKDERGAISDVYSDVVLKVAGESALAKFIMLVFNVTLRGFDAILNFMFSQWLLLLALLVIGALVGQLVAKGVPYLSGEIEKIRYIASEYRTQKKLKKLDHKTKLELKILEKDIKKELGLLAKIASHRRLHPEEQYLRDKLERYSNLVKSIKG